jgi:hypothetical protein
MVATIIRLLGQEASVGTAGSDFSGNKLIRVYNSNGGDVLLTVKDNATPTPNTIGTVTVKAGETIYVNKAGTDVLSAASTCKMVAVAF